MRTIVDQIKEKLRMLDPNITIEEGALIDSALNKKQQGNGKLQKVTPLSLTYYKNGKPTDTRICYVNADEKVICLQIPVNDHYYDNNIITLEDDSLQNVLVKLGRYKIFDLIKPECGIPHHERGGEDPGPNSTFIGNPTYGEVHPNAGGGELIATFGPYEEEFAITGTLEEGKYSYNLHTRIQNDGSSQILALYVVEEGKWEKPDFVSVLRNEMRRKMDLELKRRSVATILYTELKKRKWDCDLVIHAPDEGGELGEAYMRPIGTYPAEVTINLKPYPLHVVMTPESDGFIVSGEDLKIRTGKQKNNVSNFLSELEGLSVENLLKTVKQDLLSKPQEEMESEVELS